MHEACQQKKEIYKIRDCRTAEQYTIYNTIYNSWNIFHETFSTGVVLQQKHRFSELRYIYLNKPVQMLTGLKDKMKTAYSG